jgi:hypothetical protein
MSVEGEVNTRLMSAPYPTCFVLNYQDALTLEDSKWRSPTDSTCFVADKGPGTMGLI